MSGAGFWMDRRPARAIAGVTEASTIDGLCSAIKGCLALLDSRPVDGACFLSALKTALKVKLNDCRKKSDAFPGLRRFGTNVHMYCELSACLVFAGSRICLCRNEKELKEQLCFIAGFFENMPERGTGALSPDEAAALLNVVQEKYGLLSAVTCDRELEIYLINRSHFCCDSFLLTYKNMHTGNWLNKWLLFSLSPRLDILECNKYHVFLHEMGHVLYSSVTGGGDKMPELFGEIAFLLGFPLYEEINNPEELFADLFSAISLRGTEYSSFNPFEKVLDKDICKLLELYFGMLAHNAGRGYYDIAGIDNLLH